MRLTWLKGSFVPGEEIGIRIDHTLLQDATGTVAMLEFESLGIDSVKVEVAAQYVDHNLLQTDNKNADDHRYLQTACGRYGIHFSPAGNGVSHQVHMERFGVPARSSSGRTATRPAPQACPCWASEPEGLMWRWLWPAGLTIFHARKSWE